MQTRAALIVDEPAVLDLTSLYPTKGLIQDANCAALRRFMSKSVRIRRASGKIVKDE